MLVSALFSALDADRAYVALTRIHDRAYVQRKAARGGDQTSGARSPLERLLLAETAQSWGPARSLANCSRRAAVQEDAPVCHRSVYVSLKGVGALLRTRQACARGTMWSMSTDEEAVTVTPS